MDTEQYSKVIHVVREPIYSIESYYYWKKNIGKVEGLNWGDHLTKEVAYWRKHLEIWSNVDYPRLLIRYEDLVDNPETWLTRMLEFIDVKVDNKKVSKAVGRNNFGKLHRENPVFFRKRAQQVSDLELMSGEDLQYVRHSLRDITDLFYNDKYESSLS